MNYNLQIYRQNRFFQFSPPPAIWLLNSNLQINEYLTKRPKIKSFFNYSLSLFTIEELTTALTTPLPSLELIFHTNSLEQLRANLLAIKSLPPIAGTKLGKGEEREKIPDESKKKKKKKKSEPDDQSKRDWSSINRVFLLPVCHLSIISAVHTRKGAEGWPRGGGGGGGGGRDSPRSRVNWFPIGRPAFVEAQPCIRLPCAWPAHNEPPIR